MGMSWLQKTLVLYSDHQQITFDLAVNTACNAGQHDSCDKMPDFRLENFNDRIALDKRNWDNIINENNMYTTQERFIKKFIVEGTDMPMRSRRSF